MNPCLTSSVKMDWATPDYVFKPLNDEFNFTLDPCATAENAKYSNFFTPEQDGLSQSWKGHRVFMNPPYGREIGKWMKKAYECGAEVVCCLVPSRTDTKWWHDYAMKAKQIRYIRGRIKFVGAKYNAPFPCALVIF